MPSCAQERETFKAERMTKVPRAKGKDSSFPSVLCSQGRDGGCRAQSLRFKGEGFRSSGCTNVFKRPKRVHDTNLKDEGRCFVP